MQPVISDQEPKRFADELGSIVHSRFHEFITHVVAREEKTSENIHDKFPTNTQRIDYDSQLKHLCEKEKMTLFVDFKDVSSVSLIT